MLRGIFTNTISWAARSRTAQPPFTLEAETALPGTSRSRAWRDGSWTREIFLP